MKNDALEAFDRVIKSGYLWGCGNDLSIIRNALTNPPEVVTVDEFEMKFYQFRLGKVAGCISENIAEMFPNGIRIIKPPTD